MDEQIHVDLEKGTHSSEAQPPQRKKPKWSYKSPAERAEALKEKLRKDPYQSERHDISSIWRQVNEKNKSGAYNFERFESMQLLNLCLLQHEIREVSEGIYDTVRKHAHDEETWDVDYPEELLKGSVEKLRPLLKEYNETLISVNTVLSFPRASLKSIGRYDKTKVSKIPRLMTDLRRDLEPDGLRVILDRYFPNWAKNLLAYFSLGPGKFVKERQQWNELPIYTKARSAELEKEAFKVVIDNTARFIVSVFAAASLLVPMIIMIFSKSTNANIIITCVFVLAFGAIISFGTKSSNQEILGATAAYAAVLVVFIGASGVGG